MLMLVGVVMVAVVGFGCEAKSLSWAEVLEQNPDPKIVTDADFLKGITATKLPWRVKDEASGIEMSLEPPGKFVMGMSPLDREASDSEKLAHKVTITKAFYLTNSLGYLKLFGAEITMRHPVSCATFHAVTKIQSSKCKKNLAAKAHALTLLISRAIGTQQPRALPTFRWRPDLVSGIPIERESFAFALDRPMARFQEKDRPGILNLRDIFYIQRLLLIGLPQFQ